MLYLDIKAITGFRGVIITLYKRKVDKVKPISLGKSSIDILPSDPS